MRRGRGLVLIIFLLLTLLAAFAWLTQHPDHAVVERAQDWPLVGDLAQRFRRAWLPAPAPPAPPAAEEEPVEWVVDYELIDAKPYVWLEPGTALRQEPSDDAPVRELLEVTANFAQLERRGPWVRVRLGSGSAWARLPPQPPTGPPPLGEEPLPPGPLPPQEPDPELLAVARERLGEEPAGHLGGYDLYTDVQSSTLVAYLDRLASQLEAVYQGRYGLAPRGEPREAVLLFALRRDYRTFQRWEERISHLDARGHTGHGLVALYAGFRPHDEVGATLVHELVHLLNRRAIGPALPPWLDEGLADDLGQSRVDESGRLQPGELGGRLIQSTHRVRIFGGMAAAQILGQALEEDRLPSLPVLLDLGWSEFVAAPERRLSYAHSSFFVRYLMQGEKGALAPHFRSFLASAAAGGEVTPEALRQHLDRDWEELELGFRSWLELEAVGPVVAEIEEQITAAQQPGER